MIRRWVAVCVLSVVVVLLSIPSVDHGLIGNIGATTMAVAGFGFAGLYATGRSNWRVNQVGRSVMYFAVMIGLVMTQVSASRWTDLSYPGRDQVSGVLYAGGTLALLNMIYTLWCIQQSRIDSRL